MQEEDPSFFADFKAKINSGDHLRIKKALADAGSRLNASIESVSGMNSEQLSLLAKGLISKYNLKDENGQLSEEALKETILGLTTDGSDANMEECIEIVLVVVLLLAVTVVDVVGAVVVVTAVEVVTEYDTAVARTRGDALFLDQLVDEIAVNLN